MTTKANQPTVYLIGAGPGDPGLLTCAAAETLRRAEVCIYDYLANPELLGLLPPACEKIYVGKSAGQHTLGQEQINELLVSTAQRLKTQTQITPPIIVRLKGGDPFIFGRGGEEAQALGAAGIPFVIIPGITSGLAGAAYAGIPATQRNMATTVTLVTGHESEDKGGGTPTLNVPTLGNLLADGGTVAFYMGVRNLESIAPQFEQYLRQRAQEQNQKFESLPVAVIQWATHPHQRTVTGTLADIAQRVREANITPPAIILMGQVVKLRKDLNWFETRPLFGKRILVTRTRQQASELAQGLSALGAQVLEAPTIAITPTTDWEPIDQLLKTPAVPAPLNHGYAQWLVFTSANGVHALVNRMQALQLDSRCLAGRGIAAIGPATAEALKNMGIQADLVPTESIGEALAQSLIAQLRKTPNSICYLLQADIARPILKEKLTAAGITHHELCLYQTRKPESLPEAVVQAIREKRVDWVTFTSASTAKNLYDLLDTAQRQHITNAQRISIGPQTSAALQELGWPPTVEATQHDVPGLIEAMCSYVSTHTV